MKANYELQYQKIVSGSAPPKYLDPEKQGEAIRKCSILKEVEIEYNPVDKTRSKNCFL